MFNVPSEYKSFIFLEQGVGAAIVNAIVNGVPAWFILGALLEGSIPVWGEISIGGDVIGTAFLLPFLTTVIVSKVIAHKMKKGAMPVLAAEKIKSTPWISKKTIKRATIIGTVSAIINLFIIMAVIYGASITSARIESYVYFKAAWTGVLAGLLTPFIAWWEINYHSQLINSEVNNTEDGNETALSV